MHRASYWIPTAVLLAVPLFCQAGSAGSGLLPNRDAGPWSGLQARISLNTGAAGQPGASRFDTTTPKLQGMGLFGDYYFTRAGIGQQLTGGFRATSGVLFGATTPLWATTALGSSGYSSIARRNIGSLASPWLGEADNATLPYVGLGYSGLSLKGGWGFAADLGVMAVQPGSSVRLGRSSSAPASDELVRELRLSPVLQLGVSYTF